MQKEALTFDEIRCNHKAVEKLRLEIYSTTLYTCRNSGFFRRTDGGVCKGFYRVFEKSRVSAREVSALFDLMKFESFDLLVKSVYTTLKRQFKNILVRVSS